MLPVINNMSCQLKKHIAAVTHDGLWPPLKQNNLDSKMSSMAVRLYVPWLHYSMDVTQKLNTVTKVLAEKKYDQVRKKVAFKKYSWKGVCNLLPSAKNHSCM